MNVESKDAPKIEFPCDDYVIKIVGEAHVEYRQFVASVLVAYDTQVTEHSFSENVSKNGRFVSLTIRMRIEKIEHLELLTTELKLNRKVKMVL